MKFLTLLRCKIKYFIDRYFFYDKWTCNSCGKEIFSDEYFCDECEEKLPLITGHICNHCGRQTETDETYCLSCKNRLTDVDVARSCFSYGSPIDLLIQKYKYNGEKYLADLFVHYLFLKTTQNFFTPDYIVYVPMTDSALKKRGFNHGELLATKLAEIINVEVSHCLVKNKDTKRQAKSTAEERMSNLHGVFHLSERKHVKGKTFMLVDDVLTTGATGETIAKLLKKAGAKKVILLTVASVPSKGT